jgi:hypothetical protein
LNVKSGQLTNFVATLWDELAPCDRIYEHLKIYLNVLPASAYSRNYEQVYEQLRIRNVFLSKIISNKAYSGHFIEDKRVALLLYKVICKILFFNLDEFNRLPSSYDSSPDVDEIIKPVLNCVHGILSSWPFETPIYQAFISKRFTTNLTLLLHSPLRAERELVLDHVRKVLAVLVRKRDGLKEFVKIVLLQIGLALYDSRLGDELAGRPLDQVFPIYRECAINAPAAQLLQFSIEFMAPFTKSPFIVEYVEVVVTLMKNLIVFSSTIMEVSDRDLFGDYQGLIGRLLEMSWRNKEGKIEAATVTIALALTRSPGVFKSFGGSYIKKVSTIADMTPHVQVLYLALLSS